ncbi:amino acid adenylation domain-containing protein [Micromonospora sp. NPDC051300]|uniref:amino acid adenylation domain-containing protein n=1 Tax=Micromonospora sp. NPDC051300 TaxID=3364286 RepID=UPI0037A20B7B
MTATADPRAALSDAKRSLLAARLRAAATGTDADAPAVTPRPPGTPTPLSCAQERLWFMEQFAPGTAAYTIPVVLRIHGDVDAEVLARALERVVARHESLRMRVTATDTGEPVVHVDPPLPVPLPVLDVDHDGDERDHLVHALLHERLAQPFDLTIGPLLRAALVRIRPGEYALMLAVHHIACDGWSVDLLANEVVAWYDAYATGAPDPLAAPPVQYGDFAVWQRARLAADGHERDLAYWRSKLAGLGPLELPTDRPRPAEQTFDGAGYGVTVDGALVEELTRLGRAHGATLYMTLLTAFAAVLVRHSRCDDFAIGTPSAGRPAAELEPLIGMFVNMLTMRIDSSGAPTFAQLLARVRETTLDAYAHQDVPFEQIVTDLNLPRDVSRSALFQVVFALQNYAEPGRESTTGLRVAPFGARAVATRFDLELSLLQGPDGLWGSFTFNTALFDTDTVARLVEHFDALLRAAVTDPDRPLSHLLRLSAGERDEILYAANDTYVDFPDRATLHELIEEQVRRTPGAVALIAEERHLTYADLDAAANRVAHGLRAHGARPGTLVAVCAERGPALVVGLLGVLKSGAAYLPLDPEHPPDRLAFMITDAGVPVVLTAPATRPALPPPADGGRTPEPVVLDLDDPLVWAAYPDTVPRPLATADDVAYAIYTSGSTGRPKGVLNGHRGIVNRLLWMQRRYRLDATDAVLQKTPAGFDVSVWEFFWPLLTGARLVLARPGGHKDAAYLRDLIVAEGVTTTHFVPSMLAMFLAEDEIERCATLRRVICSGEELPVDLAQRTLRRIPQADLHNLYGPTEAAIDVTAHHCTAENVRGRARVPIGTPIDNMRVHVLDEHGEPQPVGVPGELHLAGVGLAHGYLRRPELTGQKFVPDPFGAAPGTPARPWPDDRLYRTGDLARRLADGSVDFLGRIDGQVKIRGLRIELGEIEAALRDQPGVADAAVAVREDRPGDKRLVAYVTGGPPEAGVLRAALRRRLPDYMVPTAVVTLDGLPLTLSGKLDRRALPAPPSGRGTTAGLVVPRTPTEHLVADIWKQVLGVDAVGVDDDFFDLGGHSLLATQVVARLRRAVGAGVSVMDLFKHRTVAELAALVDTPAADRGPRELLHELTRPMSGLAERTLVCVPYGGGSAVVYQPLADALPERHRLLSLAIPGHDVGLQEEALSFDALAGGCVAEIIARTEGPIVLYGHCAIGSALIVEIDRRLEERGRIPEAVYVGAMFPFARPRSRVLSALSRVADMDRLRSDRAYADWLTSLGLDMGDIEPGQARQIIRNLRRDTHTAEQYYTRLLHTGARRLAAPLITVAGDRDPATEYYSERYTEWHVVADTAAVVLLDEAGHFYLKWRAGELARILTEVHPAVRAGAEGTLHREARGPDATWWVHGASRVGDRPVRTGPPPSMRRFLAVALGQLVSILGSTLTEFALPLWVLASTGSLLNFALLAVVGLVPGLLVTPLVGAIVDRHSRRAVMLAGDVAAGGVQLVLAVLLWSGSLHVWHIYPLAGCLSVALAFQRLAYGSAVPQLVPKQYLGHANGVVQMVSGVATTLAPLAAAGLLATVGLRWILVLDVASYVVAIGLVAAIRFPRTLAWKRRESVAAEIAEGFRYSWGNRHFRAMLLFFMALNVFLSPLFMMLSPLVLSFAGLREVAEVSVAGGAGAMLGGLAMAVWGGPRHRRLFTVLCCTLGLAACCVVIGLRPQLWLVAAGSFGISLWLVLLNGVYATIVQVKVPQRFHGRVLSLNTVIAWSTLPVGWTLVGPVGSHLLEPLMQPGGALAGTAGRLLGVGDGRGTGLLYLILAAAIAAVVLVSLRRPRIATFDDAVPDAEADDLVGVAALRGRLPTAPSARPAADPDKTVRR